MKTADLRRTIKQNLILSASYLLIGKAALWLTSSHFHITGLSPVAGIAAASILLWGYKLAPGILLGAFGLGLWTGNQIEVSNLTTIFTSTFTATGVTLQSIVGVWLVRHFIGHQPELTNEKEIFYFIVLIGPIACLIGATLGTTSFLITNLINQSEFGINWLFWWINDSIAALVISPLMLIFYASPGRLWKSRRLSVAPALLCMLLVTAVIFTLVLKWENERLHFEFKEASSETYEKLKTSFTYYIDAITSIERLLTSAPEITRSQFKTFVEKILSEKPGIHGVSWNPLVYEKQRKPFEEAIRKEGFTNFKISQRDKHGKLTPAYQRPSYIVVNYIEPMKKNLKAFGFDVSSNHERLKAMNQARDTGKPVATSRITLVQETERQAGFLLFYPVYKIASTTTIERRKNLAGYAVGVFRVGDIVELTLSNKNNNKLITNIYDESEKGKSIHLFGVPFYKGKYFQVFESNKALIIGERQWSVRFRSSESFLTRHHSSQVITTLITGLFFSIMFNTFILAMSGRSYQLDKQVNKRTKELKENQKKLIITNKTLEKTIVDLERSNKELDQYAFVASHDLKSPLQSIFQLASWIEEDCGNILPEDSKRHLNLLKERIRRMENLLADLLVFSRISRDQYNTEKLDLQAIIKRTFEFNSTSDNYRLKIINCDVSLILPRIPLELIFRNLFSNAIKHHDKTTGEITVNYRKSTNEHIISVTDDGPGIPPGMQEKVYEMFNTLKPRDETEGSGLGLCIIKKAAEQFDGKVKIISDGLRNTSIEICWNIQN